MNFFEKYVPLFSEKWKEKYHAILHEENLIKLTQNVVKFQNNSLHWDLPYFNEEIIINRNESFEKIITILQSEESDNSKTLQLEKVNIEDWLNIFGQRLTSASIRDERAIPPPKNILIEACQKPFNNEITIAQRAWEKHVGRMDDEFWGEIKGNNQQKQEKVLERINNILDNVTWWNIFFHYKHELVFEVREKHGHGIRWSHGGQQLIGFLETFINE
ncbi:hypothetical protein [Chryseobacterium oryctis]|uniref:Uncharacterized protein n=1 Tax=Chryseobacterium oryctis TaxID=2952618 RepID=A0ABT3HJP1_9FLAO|nr:hypothetical protein [Chryseobacterium oryctis]MCW3160012.1 hypothetical protein [Chryseobacterium oryctis]